MASSYSLANHSAFVDFVQGLSALALDAGRAQAPIHLVMQNYLPCFDLMREQFNDFLDSLIWVEVAQLLLVLFFLYVGKVEHVIDEVQKQL